MGIEERWRKREDEIQWNIIPKARDEIYGNTIAKTEMERRWQEEEYKGDRGRENEKIGDDDDDRPTPTIEKCRK